jgi:hypothetical protein
VNWKKLSVLPRINTGGHIDDGNSENLAAKKGSRGQPKEEASPARTIARGKSPSPMAEWIEFAPWSELSPEEALERVVADRVIAIFRLDAILYAIDGIGSHQGEVHGSLVRCPWHG